MKIKPYIERLHSSQIYKEFTKKHKNSFVVAGFFILDLEAGKNVHQIDYYVPAENKVAAFTLDNGVNMQMMNLLNTKKAPEKLDMKTNIDLSAIQGILQDEMKNRGITEELKKIIAILQTVDGKKLWNINCVMSGMGILRAHIEDESKSVLKMEKVNMMDYVQKIKKPLADIMNKNKSISSVQKADSKKLIQDEIKKLDTIEEQIEKKKTELNAALNKNNIKTKPVKSASSKEKKN